jgi:hypothetical protein
MPDDRSILGSLEAALLVLIIVIPAVSAIRIIQTCCHTWRGRRWWTGKPSGCVQVLATMSEDEETARDPPIARRCSGALMGDRRRARCRQPLPRSAPSMPETPGSPFTRCYLYVKPPLRGGPLPVLVEVPLEGVETMRVRAPTGAHCDAPTHGMNHGDKAHQQHTGKGTRRRS